MPLPDSGSALRMATLDSRSTLAARAARFRREEQRPPPPLPTNRITVSEGKVVTSDKDLALRKLIERKAAAGVQLTADQQRALSSLGASANQMGSRSASQLKMAPSRGTTSTSQLQQKASCPAAASGQRVSWGILDP